jgi:hypothetical protein
MLGRRQFLPRIRLPEYAKALTRQQRKAIYLQAIRIAKHFTSKPHLQGPV